MIENKINLVLFYCEVRNSSFGQTRYLENLLPHFRSSEKFNLYIVKTDVGQIDEPTKYRNNFGDIVISLPKFYSNILVVAENSNIQIDLANRIVAELIPHFQEVSCPIFWINSADYFNVVKELKLVIKGCRILYVHHAFSWKYFKHISDERFIDLWNNKNSPFDDKAFELTNYQLRTVQEASHTVCVTNSAKHHFLQGFKLPCDKISTIYNGVTLNWKKSIPKAGLRRKYGFSEQEMIITFAGRVYADKGIPELLIAFNLLLEKMPACRLLIAGAGEISKYLHLIKPNWRYVTFTGEVDKDQISDFLLMSDIGVIPSLHEQCSLTAIEMRLNSLPVIVTDTDGLGEVFEHEVDALKVRINIDIDGNKKIDVLDLYKQMHRLLLSPDLKSQLILNSLAKARASFSSRKMYLEYYQLLKSM